MACFAVPLAEAVVVTVAKKVLLRSSTDAVINEAKAARIEVLREKIGWLQKMLYGGSFLLAIEHVYHGEVVLYPPFLTAMRTPEEIPVMLHEMATVGVGMAVLTTAVWGAIVAVSSWLSKRGSGMRLAGGIA